MARCLLTKAEALLDDGLCRILTKGAKLKAPFSLRIQPE